MHVVGPGRGHRIEDHARGLAELGGEARRDDLDLAHDHLGDGQEAEPRPVLLRVGVAVDLVVRVHLGAVGVDAGHPELLVLEAGDVGLEEREVVGVARDEGEVLDLGLRDRAPEVDLPGLGHGEVAAHRHDLLHASHLEGDVQDGGLSRGEGNPGAFRRLEARKLHAHLVGAEGQQGRLELSVRPRDQRALGAHVDVGHRHRGPRQDRSRRVLDDTFDRAVDRGGLGGRHRGRAEKREDCQRGKTRTHVVPPGPVRVCRLNEGRHAPARIAPGSGVWRGGEGASSAVRGPADGTGASRPRTVAGGVDSRERP